MLLKKNLKEKTLPKKLRLDQHLVDLKLFESKNKAQASIMSGEVLVEETPVLKPGFLLTPEKSVRVKEKPKYVSRGGLKLEKAIDVFQINCSGKICLDIGSSTGGFSDCLLQREAKRIIAVDVGTNQMHYKIRNNPRVSLHERINARFLSPEILNVRIDILTMDVSFISIKKLFDILSKMLSVLSPSYFAVFLVKPQFEGNRSHVNEGGIVKFPEAHIEILTEVVQFFNKKKDCFIKGIIPSPIKGNKGNIEYLLGVGISKNERKLHFSYHFNNPDNIKQVVEMAFENLVKNP